MLLRPLSPISFFCRFSFSLLFCILAFVTLPVDATEEPPLTPTTTVPASSTSVFVSTYTPTPVPSTVGCPSLLVNPSLVTVRYAEQCSRCLAPSQGVSVTSTPAFVIPGFDVNLESGFALGTPQPSPTPFVYTPPPPVGGVSGGVTAVPSPTAQSTSSPTLYTEHMTIWLYDYALSVFPPDGAATNGFGSWVDGAGFSSAQSGYQHFMQGQFHWSGFPINNVTKVTFFFDSIAQLTGFAAAYGVGQDFLYPSYGWSDGTITFTLQNVTLQTLYVYAHSNSAPLVLSDVKIETSNYYTPTLAPSATPSGDSLDWTIFNPADVDCSVPEYRPVSQPLFYVNLSVDYVERSCYQIVPEFTLGTFTSDGIELCIDWYRLPSIVVFGLVISADLVLVFPLAWLVRRLLQY